MIHIFRVHAIFGQKCNARHFKLQLAILFKKWAGEIELLCILLGTPPIAPPTRWAIDFQRFVGRVNRNHAFAAEVTITTVEYAFISPSIPTLTTTLETKRRWRDLDFCIEIEILGLGDEVLFTALAIFGLGNHCALIC